AHAPVRGAGAPRAAGGTPPAGARSAPPLSPPAADPGVAVLSVVCGSVVGGGPVVGGVVDVVGGGASVVGGDVGSGGGGGAVVGAGAAAGGEVGAGGGGVAWVGSGPASGGWAGVVGVEVAALGPGSGGGGSTSWACAAAAWIASRVPSGRLTDPVAATTTARWTTWPPTDLTRLSLAATPGTGSPSWAASWTATWAAATALPRAVRALGSWLNILSSIRSWTSSRRSSATRVRSPASRDGDHWTEAMRSCSMASLKGYMACP